MCTFKTLHHNQHGYIIKCSQCNYIQTGFGSFSVSQTPDEFNEFKQAIYEHLAASKFSHEMFPERKSIRISTPLKNMFWVFSLNELKQLTELLEQASLALEVEKIFTAIGHED